MNSVPKVATPFTAVALVVPPSTAPAVPVPAAIATVIVPLKLVTTLFRASVAATFTAGVIWWLAWVVVGSVVNNSFVAAPPGWTVKLALVAAVSPVAEAASV